MSVTTSSLPAERFDRWRAETRDRVIARQRESGLRPGSDAAQRADALFAELLPEGAASTASDILSIRDGADEIGLVWIAVKDRKLFVLDLHMRIDPRTEAAPSDAVFDALCALASSRGAVKLTMSLTAEDAEGRAFVADRASRIASIQMLLAPVPDRRGDVSLDVVPMTAKQFPHFTARSTRVFADELFASGRYTTHEQAVEESRRQMRLELPDGLDTEGQELFTASVDGVDVGVLWLGHRVRDGRPHVFVLDIEVYEAHRGKGYGRALMHAVEAAARRAGAESIGLHVFGDNAPAIALYEGLGYRRIEEVFLLDLPRTAS